MIIKISNRSVQVTPLFEIGADTALPMRIYSTRISTVSIGIEHEQDVVRHRKHACHLCGCAFDRYDPPSANRPEWCVDCYERFVKRGGRFAISNLMAMSNYWVQLNPRPRARPPVRQNRK